MTTSIRADDINRRNIYINIMYILVAQVYLFLNKFKIEMNI